MSNKVDGINNLFEVNLFLTENDHLAKDDLIDLLERSNDFLNQQQASENVEFIKNISVFKDLSLDDPKLLSLILSARKASAVAIKNAVLPESTVLLYIKELKDVDEALYWPC